MHHLHVVISFITGNLAQRR